MSTEPKYDNDGNLEARVDEFDEPMTTRIETALSEPHRDLETVYAILDTMVRRQTLTGAARARDIVDELVAAAAALEPAMVECAICGDYSAQGVEVHELCLSAERAARGQVEAALKLLLALEVGDPIDVRSDEVVRRARAALSPSTITPEAPMTDDNDDRLAFTAMEG